MKDRLIVTPGFSFKKSEYQKHLITTHEKTRKRWLGPDLVETSYGVYVYLTDGGYIKTFDTQKFKEAENLYKDIVKQLGVNLTQRTN